MSRRGDHRASARLVALQRLATALSREELGRACLGTDERAEAERGALERNREAEMTLEAVFAHDRLCLDRLALAGFALKASEAEITASRAALATARNEEASALASYGDAEQRLRWLSSHARDLRRKHLEKREEHALSDAVMLRATGRIAR